MGSRRIGKQLRLVDLLLGVGFFISLLASVCDGHSSRRLPLAGIFGMGGNKDTSQQRQRQQGNPQNPPSFQQQRQYAVPPPPGGTTKRPQNVNTPGHPLPPRVQAGTGDIPGPPRLVRQTAGPIAPPKYESHGQNLPQRGPPPPPPKPSLQSSTGQNETNASQLEHADSTERGQKQKNDADQSSKLQLESGSYGMQQPPPEAWFAPPPMDDGNWGPPPAYYDPYENGDPMYMHEDMDQYLARENELIAQLDNLTEAIMVMEQREELHVRQLDVLTERIMDIEAQAARDRNLVLEYESNHTELGVTIASLQEEAEDWKNRCSEFEESREKDMETISDLKASVKDKEREVEEIAVAIENLRIAEKRREAMQARRGARKKGLLARFFGLFFAENDDFEEMSQEEVYEMAKSTLLRALQSERGNVHELEGVVTALQQNNSAISEMVESRDTIIDELNNRISVFEEDKVVLKAALRQLQKEIKEEAPKAQKLMDDLKTAKDEIERLKEEMNGLIRTHQDELNMLQQTISTKQKTLSESESNLTAIGTYVDKLEDRLTSFAVTRRDMEQREKRCKEIEEAAAVIESEKKELEAKVKEYSKEQEEVKKLLEELVTERAKLQKDNRKLATDSEFRIAEQEQLQQKCTSLECEVKELSDALEELRGNSDALKPALEAAEQTNSELQDRVERAIEQEAQLGRIKLENSYLQDELSQLKAEKAWLEAELDNATNLVEKLEVSDDEDGQASVRFAGKPRNVPLRAVRKQFAKVTGIHGAITPSSTMLNVNASNSVRHGQERERTKVVNNPLMQKVNTVGGPPPKPPPRRP